MSRFLQSGVLFWPLFVFCAASSLLSAQSSDTAPFFKAVSSFRNNGEAFEAEFRNGMRVLVEETFNTPLVAVNLLIVFEPGQPPQRVSSQNGPIPESMEKELLALGGFVTFEFNGEYLELKVVVPGEEIENCIEILGRLNKDTALEPIVSGSSAGTGRDKSSIIDLRTVQDKTLASLSPPPQAGMVTESKAEENAGQGKVAGMVFAGSARHEVVFNSIADNFPPDLKVPEISLSEIEHQTDPEEDQNDGDGVNYLSFPSRLEFPVFTLGCRIPPRHRPGRAELEVLGRLIGGGLASLPRTDEEELGLNFQHRVDLLDTPLGSFLVVTAAVHPEFLDRVEMHFLSLFHLLGTSEMPGSLVTRAKSLSLLERLEELDSITSRADALSSSLARGFTGYRKKGLDDLARIDPAKLRQTASNWLSRDRLFIREFIPSGFIREFNTKSFNETVDILLPQVSTVSQKRIEKLSLNQPEISFSVPGLSKEFSPSELKKSSVLRGPDIYIYELHNSPLVRIGLFYPGGYREEGPADDGLTEILVASILQHWSLKGYDRSMVGLEGLGARLEGVIHPDYFGFRGTVLSSDFERFLAGLVEMITEHEIEDDHYARYRNLRKYSEFLENSAHPKVSPDEILPDVPGIDYRLKTSESGTPPSSLTGQFRKITETHPEIVIYGDVKGTSFLRGLVPLLSNSSLKKVKKPERRNRDFTRIEPIPLPVDDPGSRAFIASGIPANSGQEEGLRLITHSMDGTNIRIEWIILAKEGYSLIRSSVNRMADEERHDPAQILRNLREKKFSEREFNRAKVRSITAHFLRTEDPFELMDYIAVRVLAGERGDFIKQQLTDLKQVNVVEVESLLETLFGD